MLFFSLADVGNLQLQWKKAICSFTLKTLRHYEVVKDFMICINMDIFSTEQ